MIDEKDKPLLSKLGCESIIDLSLQVPKSYDDYFLYERRIDHTKQALDVTIQSWQKSGQNLKISFFCHNLNLPIQGIIFHPKPFHYASFTKKDRIFIFGELEHSNWGLSISQPQKITKVESIQQNFASVIRNDTHQALVARYVTTEKLCEEGLPLKVAQSIETIFHPQHQDVARYNQEGVTKSQRAALKFAEVYNYMKKLSKKRMHFSAMQTSAVSSQGFIEALPFRLTQDQLQSIEEIYKDLHKSEASKRMIIGDVGSGKTMVILATAYMNQKGKSLLMAPTLLLAMQLYEEAQKFLPKIRSILVTNKHNKKTELKGYDFIIGTHALLYKALPEANVVMIDEQHRFGTKQRNLIEKMVMQGDRKPHVFQFSATPIPRTQAMVNSALLDVSLIQQTPFTKDITTELIGKHDFPLLLDHIRNEITQDHQVLIVYPLVEESDTITYQSIDEARHFWEERFSDVYVTHGQDKNKDEVLLEFREKGAILISTTVVEVGISLPKLSTVVIVGAERMGLATLHQLRGRVSRTGLKGYCYLFTYAERSERLADFSRLKSGFDIAALDLKYRSSGDLLSGRRQSGFKYLWFDEAEDEWVVEAVKKYRKEEESSSN